MATGTTTIFSGGQSGASFRISCRVASETAVTTAQRRTGIATQNNRSTARFRPDERAMLTQSWMVCTVLDFERKIPAKLMSPVTWFTSPCRKNASMQR
jgi:hypothetical protein